MQITDLTTYPDVRAVLGVSDEELEDAELALSVWSTNMTLKLYDLTPTFETLFDSIELIPENSRTAIQQRFFITAKLYGAYLVADDLLVSLPMFSFKSITDGKAETERFDRWEDVRDGVKAGVAGIRARLMLMLQTLEGAPVPTVTLPGLIAGVTLGADPVTGV